MSRPIFLIFKNLKKGSWKLPRKQTFLFPYIFSIAVFVLFVNSFFSVGEKVENIPGLSFRLYRAVKKINSLLLYKGYQKMRGQSILPGLCCADLPPISRTRACACVRAHLYAVYAGPFIPNACRASYGGPQTAESSIPPIIPAPPGWLLLSATKKKAAPKRKPSLFFCCTRFVFFISAPKRGKWNRFYCCCKIRNPAFIFIISGVLKKY